MPNKKVIPLILAAGKSSRSINKTYPMPKLLINITGKTILERNIAFLEKIFKKIYINLYFHKKKYLNFINNLQLRSTLEKIVEKKIMGTAGVLHSFKKIDFKNILVVYGDNLVNINIKDFINFHEKNKSLISIAVYSTKYNLNSSYGSSSIRVSKNKVDSFYENNKNIKNKNKEHYINSGILLINKKIIKFIPKNKYYDLSNDLIKDLLIKNIDIYCYKLKKDQYCLAFDTITAIRNSKKIIKHYNIL
tara:strand:+ start:473 stop:1216 length:744 start_codon:yes stop_codon:yes gene_type:complete